MNSKKTLLIGSFIVIVAVVVSLSFFQKAPVQTDVVYTNTIPRDVDWEKSIHFHHPLK